MRAARSSNPVSSALVKSAVLRKSLPFNCISTLGLQLENPSAAFRRLARRAARPALLALVHRRVENPEGASASFSPRLEPPATAWLKPDVASPLKRAQKSTCRLATSRKRLAAPREAHLAP